MKPAAVQNAAIASWYGCEGLSIGWDSPATAVARSRPPRVLFRNAGDILPVICVICGSTLSVRQRSQPKGRRKARRAPLPKRFARPEKNLEPAVRPSVAIPGIRHSSEEGLPTEHGTPTTRLAPPAPAKNFNTYLIRSSRLTFIWPAANGGAHDTCSSPRRRKHCNTTQGRCAKPPKPSRTRDPVANRPALGRRAKTLFQSRVIVFPALTPR